MKQPLSNSQQFITHILLLRLLVQTGCHHPSPLDKLQGLSYLFIRRDIEHGRARFRLLHGEGDEGVDQLDGRIETAAVAGVIVFVTAIQSRVNLSLVIFAHMHGNVEMSGVAVRQTAEGHHVTVEVFRLHA